MTADLMGAKVTPELRAEIEGILLRVDYRWDAVKRIAWGQGDWPRVVQLAKELAGYRPSSSCISCHLKALNIMRNAVDLPGIGEEASPSLRARRLQVCHACPAYDGEWNSCGRFVADAFSSEPVTDHDGTLIHPCGCNVGLKASFRFFSCPAGKWPSK